MAGGIEKAAAEVRPAMAIVKLPMPLTAFHGTTRPGQPFGDLMQRAVGLEQSGASLSASLFFVGSYIDVPKMGCAVVVMTFHECPGMTTECPGIITAFERTLSPYGRSLILYRCVLTLARILVCTCLSTVGFAEPPFSSPHRIVTSAPCMARSWSIIARENQERKLAV